MKQTIIHSLIVLSLFFSFQTKAACNYSFGLISQNIHNIGQTGTLTSLVSCEDYTFDYIINFSSQQTTISDQITIHLPIGIEYISFLSSNGTATYVSGSSDVVFNLSNWNVNNPLTLSFIGRTPCMNQSQPATGTTSFTGVNSCSGPTNVSQSISCYSSNIYAQLLQPSPLLKNIGDIGELVFELKNSSGNGSFIRDVEVHLQPEATIAFYQNNYYLSTSNAVPSGNSIYSYVLPSGVNVQSIPSNQIISIGQSDWNDVLNQNTLSDGQNIYLHIPYRVDSCSNSNTGHYDFYTMCNSSACDSSNVTSNIRVPDATPFLSVSSYPFENPGSYCAAASQQEMILGYHVVNSSANSSGGPLGYGKATNIDLFLTADNEFGGIDPNTFTISNGSVSIPIPNSLVTLVSSSFFNNASGHVNSVYRIQLSQLAVNGNSWNPLGNNSLADLDGDHFLDDVIEGGSFDIKVTFTYQTQTCPFFANSGADYIISTLQSNHFNQCGTFIPGSALQGSYNPNGGSIGVYRYDAKGSGASLDLPTDVLAGTDFVSILCFAPIAESYYFNGFDFNCPDGYHRVRYSVPPGYHLNTAGLVSSTGNPGWYELPDIVATAASCGSSATQLITPIAKEICSTNPNERIIEIRFGRIDHNQACGQGVERTFQLPCMDLPMFINCSLGDSLCIPPAANFGFDNFHFVFDYVCDESCSSCGAFIERAIATTFHHCLDSCDSYFDTNPDFVFTRSDLGFSNPNETAGDTIIDCDNPGTPLTNSSFPSIDTKAGYPGDQVAVHASGHFQGSPAPGFIPYTGADFGLMGLQIRYNAFPGGVALENRVFDLEMAPGDGFLVTCVNNSSSFFIDAADLTFTDVLDNNIVHMNIGFPQSAKDLMNQTGYTYEFTADLHLRVRMSPTNAQGRFFSQGGTHILTSLRAEFLGYVNGVKYGSCDDYGAKFKILQPSVGPYLGYNNHPDTCGIYTMQIDFQNAGAKYDVADDFPNEFRSYAEITGPVTIEVPNGYSVVSAEIQQVKRLFSQTGINNFDNINQPPNLSFPVDFTTSQAGGGTLLTLTGTGGNACWPELDLDKKNSVQKILVKLRPDCYVANVDTVSVSMNYTLSAQQPNPVYQHPMSFQGSFPLKHISPLLSLNGPSTNVSTLNGTGVFDFSLCTQPPANPYNLYPGAGMAWIAFENSSVNGLDLTTATLINTDTNQPVPFTVYSNGGTQSIIANLGLILANHCINLRLTAHVNANGCVDNNAGTVADFINVLYGNSCSGQQLSSPVAACQQGTETFEFNRFPSRLELLTNNNSFPGPAEMCNGLLEYHFVLNSAELGPVINPQFWLDLPAGITLQSVTFAYPAILPVTLTAFDGSTYGPNGNLGGWNILSHLGLTNLPGSGSYPDNQLAVTVRLQSSCSYDLSSGITFSAQGINTCGTSQETESAFHIPEIENTTLISDLDIDWSFSTTDNSPEINCSNSGTVSITVHNNSNSDNITGLDITAQVPAGVFTINPGSGSLNNDEITWHIPSGGIPEGGSSSVTFEVSLANDSICQLNAPFSISIAMTEDVACSASGGSCQVELQSEPLIFDIDACCNSCDMQLSVSSEPAHCKASFGSASVSATGTSGTLTYLWSDGQTTATANNLAAGNYSVIVTDASGCSDTAFVTVVINTPVLITATADQYTICSGQSASIILEGGSSYTVYNGNAILPVTGNPFSVSPTQTTTYTVQASDQYGCFGNTSITITVVPHATMNDPADLSVCAGTLVAIPSFTGPVSITDYSWSNSNTQIGLGASGSGAIPSFIATNNGITPISATLTVTPNSGNCSGIPQTFTITINPVPVMDTLTEAVLCAGTVVNPLPFTSTIPGTTFTGVFSNPAIGYVDATGTSFTATNSGTTPISGVITVTPSAGGCQGLSQSLTLTVNPAITPVFASFGPYCLGTGSHTLPTISSNGISGTWSPAAVNANSPGTANYTFTPASEQCATAISTSVSVLINTVPIFDEFGPYCQNEAPASLPAVSDNGINGTWSPAVINTSNIGTSNYVFTPNSGTCVSSNTIAVVVTPPAITPTFPVFGPYCLGTGSHTLPTTSLNGISGTWSPAAVNANSPGTASYTFTPASGQCATAISTSVSVLINTVPIFDEFGPYCQNAAPASLPAVSDNGINGTWSPAVINTSNIGTSNYVFTPNSGTCVSLNTTQVVVKAAVTPVFPVFGPYCKSNSPVSLPAVSTNGITGTWSPAFINTSVTGNATYTFTPAAGECATTKTIVVTVNLTPNFFVVSPAATICSGQSAVLFAVPQPLTETGYSYSWSPSATLSSSVGSTVTATPSVTTTYTITATKLGCQSTKTFTVVVIPVPAAPVISGPSTICTGGSVGLQAIVPGSPIPTGYLWTSSGGAAPIVGTNPSILVSSPGTYTVTVSYSTGCQTTSSFTVNPIACPNKCNLKANFNSSGTLCTRLFTSTSTVGIANSPLPASGYTYNWTISNAATGAIINGSAGTGSNLSYTFPSAGLYTVCLKVYSLSNPDCHSEICKTLLITCKKFPFFILTKSKGLLAEFDLQPEESAENGEDLTNLDYSWDFGDGTSSSEAKPVHQFKGPGYYDICLKIASKDNPSVYIDSVCKSMYVSEDVTQAKVTPFLSVNPNPVNGETTISLHGVNDQTVEIKLYTISGELINTLFEKACCQESSLDLIWNAQDLPPGVYLVKALINSETYVEKVIIGSR